jgi:hypothetical protein
MCKCEKIIKIYNGYIQFLHSNIFKDLGIKKMPMDSFKFSNLHEIKEFEDHKKTNI